MINHPNRSKNPAAPNWSRFGDTPEAGYARLDELYQDRLRQVDALYAEKKVLLAALKTTAGNIKSLADASLRTENDGPLGPWLEVVNAAIARAES